MAGRQKTPNAEASAESWSEHRAAKTRAHARLLERERELSEIAAALDGALDGRGSMVFVEGPPGIGKSELLRAVRAPAAGRAMRVLAARGLEVEREIAFGGVRQLLEPMLQAAPPQEAVRLFAGAGRRAAGLFGGGVRAPIAEADPTFATLNALYWVLAAVADTEPVVALIDDAHWLDRPSLRLLEFLATRIEDLPAVVIVATRPPPQKHEDALLGRLLADPVTRVIRPRPLSGVAMRELVSARLGREADPVFLERCAEVTAGNPFYLSELLRELELRAVRGTREEAALVREVGPRKISLALRFRSAASAEGIALARAVAVLGDGAQLKDAGALAGLEDDAATAAADALVHESIFGPPPALAFTHPIVRTAVYTEIGPNTRARAHGRAARQLHCAGAAAERIAAHLLRVEPARDPWVVEMLRAAGSAVLAQGAPDMAVDYLRRALAEPPDDAVRASVLLELGRAEASAAHPEAARHLVEAYALAPDARTRGAAASPAAYHLYGVGRTAEAIPMLAAVAEELAHEEPDRALELEAQLISLAMYDPASAERYLPRLDLVDEDLRPDSPGARMMLCQLAYRRMWRANDASRAADLAERALAEGVLLAERGTDAPELSAAAMTLIHADRVAAAEQLLDAALALARERGSRFGFSHVSFLRSELAYRRGDLDVAEAEARASLEVTIEARILPGVAAATGRLVAVLLERGATDEACAALDAMWVPFDELPAEPAINVFVSAHGRTRVARGDLDGGLAELSECGRRNEQLGIRHPSAVPWRADAALAHRARGESGAARALAEAELRAARDWGTPGAIGAARWLMGLLSSGDEAFSFLREATAALAESPARLEQARALVDLGAALRRANRRSEAREPLTRGLDLADRCGATVLSRRAHDELRAIGARPRRARLTGVDALTASERRVAEMAATGLSNMEIAQTLFVSRKTVEKHLGNAYTKLGVKSRAELTTQLAQ